MAHNPFHFRNQAAGQFNPLGFASMAPVTFGSSDSYAMPASNVFTNPSRFRVRGRGQSVISRLLGGAGKVASFAGNPLVGAGIGLLGGLIGARQAAQRNTSRSSQEMVDFMSQLESPDLSEFRDIAREAAPSQQELMRVAAATGGSQASATAQAMGGQTKAMDAALRAFQQQQRANQGLLANLYSQQFGAMQQDRAFRRQTGVDIFSNIANLGAGILGQGYGDKLFRDRQNQMGGY